MKRYPEMDSLRFSPGFKGPTRELIVYMKRVESLTRAIVGEDWSPEWSAIRHSPDIESDMVSAYRRFELIRDAVLRVEADPLRYRELVTWADRPTLQGRGRPTVEEALFETWAIDFLEAGYFSFLDELISGFRSEGRIEETETWARRKAEAEDLGNKIGNMTHRSLQPSRP